ncbi:MAG: hypothetical protein J6M39_07305 [Lachnospiraceae bacterium]|nr:hypothetical protein [Lachnospiraceae bacterium]
MRKSTRIVKKLLALFLVVLMSINTLGAVVSDNDGSAFITKAEFDSLKNNFQSQIDQYNVSIDSKIDGAIASYLAGINIAKKTEEVSMINKLNFTFDKDFAIPTTSRGTAHVWYLYAGRNVGWYAAPGNYDRIVGEAKCSNSQGAVGAWRTENATDPGRFVIYDQMYLNGSYYDYPVAFIESIPRVEASCSGFGFEDHNDTTSNHSSSIPPFHLDNQGLTHWGSTQLTLNFILGGYTKTASGVFILMSGDTRTTPDFLTTLPGSVCSESNFYCIHNNVIDEINTSSDGVIATHNATVFWASYYTMRGSNGAVAWTARFEQNHTTNPENLSNWSLKAYRHKYNTMNINNIIVRDISNAVGEPVVYYNGLPLFTASQDGKVELKMTFENSANANTTFDINDGPFPNTTVVGGISSDIDNPEINSFTVPSSTTPVTLKFDVKKDKTYWIKALPSSGKTTIKTTGIETTGE